MAILPRKISFLRKKKTRKGFSLTELMIVVAIIAILLLVAIWAYRPQLLKGRDVRRKADLNKLEKVFEDYYNDNDCYPETPDQLVPDYLSEFPTDPVTRQPYEFSTEDCDVYRIYAKLEYEQDSAIAEVGCSSGCGPGGGTPGGTCSYNYGVCSSNAELENCALCTLSCQGNICNDLKRECYDCPWWFCKAGCEGMCSNPAYHCVLLDTPGCL